MVWGDPDSGEGPGPEANLRLADNQCFKSGFNQVSWFGFEIRIRIQEGKNDPQK